MVRQRTRTRVAQLLLGVLLFAQAAVAAAVCEMPDRSPAKALAPEPAMPCHEEPARNANLCVAHCLNPDQSADTPQLAVPAWSGVAALTIAVPDCWNGRAAILQYGLPIPAGPPPRILFQSFLI